MKNRQMAYSTIPEVVSLREVASVFRISFHVKREVEVRLPDVVLALYFSLSKTRTGDAEEACLVHLPVFYQQNVKDSATGISTASLSCSASLCF